MRSAATPLKEPIRLNSILRNEINYSLDEEIEKFK
jgi:hypothetical protein